MLAEASLCSARPGRFMLCCRGWSLQRTFSSKATTKEGAPFLTLHTLKLARGSSYNEGLSVIKLMDHLCQTSLTKLEYGPPTG